MAYNVFTIEEIAEMAVDTRLELINRSVDMRLLAILHKQHFPLHQIRDILPQILQDFPQNNSTIATSYLQFIMGGDVTRGQYEHHPHFYLTLPRNVIVDITADQFGGPEVFVGKIRSPWQDMIGRKGNC